MNYATLAGKSNIFFESFKIFRGNKRLLFVSILLLGVTLLDAQPFIRTSGGYGQYGYIEKDAAVTNFLVANGGYGNIFQYGVRTFQAGPNINKYNYTGSGSCARGDDATSNFDNTSNPVSAGNILYSSVFVEYCGPFYSCGSMTPTGACFNERAFFVMDVVPKTDALLSGACYSAASTNVVLTFTISNNNTSGQTLNRLWLSNDGTASETTDINAVNDAFRVYYEPATGSEVFNGNESSQPLYGNYNGNATNNNEYGSDALGITIPQNTTGGLRCYIVLQGTATYLNNSAKGKTVRMAIIEDGISVTPNRDGSYSKLKMDLTRPSTNFITINDAPGGSAGGNITQCGNAAITMTGASATGTISSISWTGGGGLGSFSGSGNNPATYIFTPSTASGSFTATLQVNGTSPCGNASPATRIITWNTASTAPTGSTGGVAVCLGNTSNLSLVGTPGTGAIVQWYSTSCGVGSVGSGNSFAASPGTYYGRYEDPAPCSGVTACQTVVVSLINTNSWTNAGAGQWSTDGNWSCGYIPSASQDVVIGNGGHPTLDIDYTAAGTLTLSSGLLDIAPAKVLTVSGIADFGSQLVTFKSNASGSGAFGNLTGTVTGESNVTVERYIPATARAWRMLTIPVTSATNDLNDAWMDGRPAIPNAAAAASEPGTYGTLITGHAQQSNVNGYDFIDIPQGASSIRKYVSGGWPATPAATPLMTNKLDVADEGYMLFVRGDRRVTSGNGTPATNVLNATSLRPNGSLKKGTKSYTLAATFVKLIGNPYASTIDFAAIYGHNGTIAEKRFWRWDANNGSNGGYVIVQDDGFGGWETNPFGGESQTDITQIHSGQAFFVKGGTGGSFEIRESDKVPAGTPVTPPVVFDQQAILGKLFATLFFDNGASGLQTVDGVQARFADGNTLNANDPGDVSKANNFNENIALLRNDTLLSVEAHAWITDFDTLFLSTTSMRVRAYVLQFQPKLLQPDLVATLQDKFTGQDIDIVTGHDIITNYPFTVTADAASAATDRFRIVFKIDPTLPLTLTSAKAYSLNNGVQVDWKTVNERGLRSYEVEKSTDGRSFSKATTVAATGAGSYGWFDAAPVRGDNYYRIKAVGIDGSISYSSALKLTTHRSPLTKFSIYPNPVKGGIVGVQFSNMEKGKYSMVVYNSAGQKVVSRDITHLGGSATEEINLGTMASGVYRISLIGNGGTQNQTLVIQK